MNKDFSKRLVALAVAAVILGAVAWQVTARAASTPATAAAETATPSGPLYAERQMGNPKAPIKMYEYFSLTCPHCAKFYQETFPQLKADYIDTGKVLFISRDFPFDKPGLQAAEMVRCAPPERYFALVDMLFKAQEQWALSTDPVASLKPLGKFAGMSEAELNACFANKDLETFIVAGVQKASETYKVVSTPTFILNDGADRIDGAVSYDKFKATIEGMLAKKQP